jgi:hypothetical protein
MRQINRAVELVREGNAGKAACILTRPNLPRTTVDVQEAMKALHPEGPEELPDLPSDPPSIQQVDHKILADVITSMNRGADPGRSGWTPALLSVLTKDKECLEGLACVTRDIANGVFEGEARRPLLGSLLIALPKPNGKFDPSLWVRLSTRWPACTSCAWCKKRLDMPWGLCSLLCNQGARRRRYKLSWPHCH